MMKVSNRELGLLLGAVGILLVVLIYSLVFRTFTEKTTELDAQLAALQEEEADLMEIEESQEYYQTEVERLTEDTDAILAQFPAGINPEDEIMLVAELEKAVDIKIPSISYGSPTAIFGAGMTADEGETIEGQENDKGVTVYELGMNVSYSTSYQGLKNTINYTNDHLNRMVIDTLDVSYDPATGLTTGSMTFNLYYMTGTDKVYTEPEVPEGTLGVDNIFGTRK